MDTIRIVGSSWPGLFGDGVLGTITFECENEGSSILYLSVFSLLDATFGDPQPVDAIAGDGAIGCTAPRSLAVGDVNCDGNINSIDATLILQVAAELINSLECPENSDVNQDGAASVLDALLILQYNAGLIDQLPP
jgi:hypothetical protein